MNASPFLGTQVCNEHPRRLFKQMILDKSFQCFNQSHRLFGRENAHVQTTRFVSLSLKTPLSGVSKLIKYCLKIEEP